MDDFERELEQLVNRYSLENDSNTPDFILARYLVECLHAWNTGIEDRERWYGRELHKNASTGLPAPPEPPIQATEKKL